MEITNIKIKSLVKIANKFKSILQSKSNKNQELLSNLLILEIAVSHLTMIGTLHWNLCIEMSWKWQHCKVWRKDGQTKSIGALLNRSSINKTPSINPEWGIVHNTN